MNIPNLISLIRIFLVPLWIWLMLNGEYVAAFFVFVLAGASDALDGFLAKTFGWQTELGAYLDPLADKALLVSAFATLGILGAIPLWLTIAVISRDVMIVAAIMLAFLLRRPVKIAPIPISKINTAGQVLLAGLVLADLGFNLGLNTWRIALVTIVGILTVLSAAAYLLGWWRHMTGSHQETINKKVEEEGSNIGGRHQAKTFQNGTVLTSLSDRLASVPTDETWPSREGR